MKPGFHFDITPREYFAECCPTPALTCSTIKALLYRTAAEAAYEHAGLTPDSPDATSTAEKRFGDVAHQIALGKGRGYAVGEYDAWNTTASKVFRAEAEANGLTPIKRKDFDAAKTSAGRMKKQFESALMLLNGGRLPEYETEVVFTWQEETTHGPIWCRGMLDVWAPSIGVVVDPKFSKVLADGAFEAHAVKMGWDLQAKWYSRGVEAIRPDLAGRVRFVNTIVHPDPPHVSRSREADEATTYSLEPMIARAISRFSTCLHAEDWPGYSRLIEPWTARNYTLAERMAQATETEDYIAA